MFHHQESSVHPVVHAIRSTRVQAIPMLIGRPDAMEVVHALVEGGIQTIELLLPNCQGLDLLERVVREWEHRDDVFIGAGSVIDPDFAQAALDIGASLIVTPVVVPDVVRVVKDAGAVCICGAQTPTEMLLAHQRGADFVKLFPANAHRSPSVIRTIRIPLPQLSIIATGGITAENATNYISAGATAVGIGYALIGPDHTPFPPEKIIKRSQRVVEELAIRNTVAGVEE